MRLPKLKSESTPCSALSFPQHSSRLVAIKESIRIENGFPWNVNIKEYDCSLNFFSSFSFFFFLRHLEHCKVSSISLPVSFFLFFSHFVQIYWGGTKFFGGAKIFFFCTLQFVVVVIGRCILATNCIIEATQQSPTWISFYLLLGVGQPKFFCCSGKGSNSKKRTTSDQSSRKNREEQILNC